MQNIQVLFFIIWSLVVNLLNPISFHLRLLLLWLQFRITYDSHHVSLQQLPRELTRCKVYQGCIFLNCLSNMLVKHGLHSCTMIKCIVSQARPNQPQHRSLHCHPSFSMHDTENDPCWCWFGLVCETRSSAHHDSCIH